MVLVLDNSFHRLLVWRDHQTNYCARNLYDLPCGFAPESYCDCSSRIDTKEVLPWKAHQLSECRFAHHDLVNCGDSCASTTATSIYPPDMQKLLVSCSKLVLGTQDGGRKSPAGFMFCGLTLVVFQGEAS